MLYTTLFFGCAAAKSLIKPTDKTYVQGSLGEICEDRDETEIWDLEILKDLNLQKDFIFTCKQAAEVFGYSFSTRPKQIENRPRGCFAKNFRVYFNNPKKGGKPHDAIRPICRADGVYDEKCEDKCKPWTASNMCGHIDDKTPSSCKASRSRRQAEDDDEPNDEPTTSRRPSSSHSRPAATPHRRHRTSTTSKRNSLSRSSQKIAHSAARLAQADSKTIMIVVVGTTLVIGLAIGIPVCVKYFR